jgi:sulfide:quinone oxidoreductase
VQPKQLTNDLAVAPQIGVGDIAAIKAQGFRSLICNRPDGEAADQTAFAEIEAAARSAGLEVRYLPVIPGKFTSAEAAAFGAMIAELPKPVLAYCRSGSRSALLWDAAQRVA